MENKLGRNDPCWCGSGKKYKKCHEEFDNKIAWYKSEGHIVPDHSMIKTPEQIEKIRESCRINIAVLDYVAENIRVGMTTQEIDDLVSQKTAELGGIPAPLNYEGYPKSVCTSINEVVCHGIPSDKNGYFSDSSRMFCIGNVSPENRKLVDVVKECVELGLEKVQPWAFLGDMGQAVNDHAKANGYSVVREIGGHGVGLEFHEDPWVSYVSKAGTEMLLVPGMIFTIEPMVNMGTHRVYVDKEDNWTIYTADGKDSAQWEHTFVMTEDGPKILTH